MVPGGRKQQLHPQLFLNGDLKLGVCFTAGRLNFYGPNSEIAAPVQGQTFHYFGANAEKFEEVFSAIGAVLEPKAWGAAPESCAP